MARAVTLAALRTRVRRRADIESATDRYPDAEINDYISTAYGELHDLLVRSGLSYYETTATINTVAGTASYVLPDDYRGTVGVDYRSDGTNWVSIPQISPQERNRYNYDSLGYAQGYRIAGSYLVFYPTPSAAQVYRHIYVPAPAALTTDSQTVDGVAGWEELLVVDAAIRCLQKEESDTRHLAAERERLVGRIQEAAQDRRLSGAAQVVDVTSSLDDDRGWYRDRWGVR